jgi:hypothetical protein
MAYLDEQRTAADAESAAAQEQTSSPLVGQAAESSRA